MKKLVLIGVLLLLVGCGEPEEPQCEHTWTPGATQEYVQELLASDIENITHYYTCIICGKQIGSVCELDTSVAGDIFTKASRSLNGDEFDLSSSGIALIEFDVASTSDISFGGGSQTEVLFEWSDGKFNVVYDPDKCEESAGLFFECFLPYLNENIEHEIKRRTGVEQ